MIAYTISGNGNISLVLNGRQFYVTTDDPNRQAVIDALTQNATEDEIQAIVDRAERIQKHVEYQTDSIRVEYGRVLSK